MGYSDWCWRVTSQYVYILCSQAGLSLKHLQETAQAHIWVQPCSGLEPQGCSTREGGKYRC